MAGRCLVLPRHLLLGHLLGAGEPVTELVLTGPLTLRLGAPDGPDLVLVPLTRRRRNARPPLDDGREARESAPGPITPLASAPLTIGRAADADFRFDDLLVSREHARLLPGADGSWTIEDLDSVNGTFVNGEATQSRPVRTGDRVTVGNSSFVLDLDVLTPSVDRAEAGLAARDVWVRIPDGPVLLSGVSLDAPPGTLTAIVGPSGAGKSTLLRALTGLMPPSAGRVEVLGGELYENYEELVGQIGYVPQDDIVHPQLTIREALRFGAELRFPEEATPAEREHRVEEVLDSLGLLPHADKRVSQLSGGQRKRVSVGLELLTEPKLLLLDEPTSGLDPAYERSIMDLLRMIADAGRTVIVVTHSLASVDRCDQVVFLGTGGWIGYVGPAAGAAEHFGVQGYPEVFARLETQPPPPGQPPPSRDPPSSVDQRADRAYPNGVVHQIITLVHRQLKILEADRRALIVMVLAGLIPSALIAALVAGNALNPGSANVTEARTLLGTMVVTVCVIGAANGVREIVKELPVYQRERAAGLHRTAYLASKVLVFGTITALQASIVVFVAAFRAGGPATGNVVRGLHELWLDMALAGVATLMLGLVISALVSTSEKAMASIPILFVVLWLFSGSISDLSTKPVLREASLLSPSSWGMAASASSADLLDLEQCGRPQATTARTDSAARSTSEQLELHCDARWSRGIVQWAFDLLMLLAIGAVGFLLADLALARKEPLPRMRRQHLAGSMAEKIRDLAST